MLDNVKSDPFDIAKQNLIEPYGLTEGDLFDLHNKLEVKGVDFADIYLQSIISESWNLEEGIVKGGAFLIDQGFGVRTVSGDRTSFAFSDTISQKTLGEAVKNTLAISRTSTEKKKSIYLDGNKKRKNLANLVRFTIMETRSMLCLPKKRLSFCKRLRLWLRKRILGFLR